MSTPPSAAPASANEKAPSASAAEIRAPRSFSLMRPGVVTSLAVAKPPKIGAVIDGGVVLHDAKGFRELPRPPSEAGWRDVGLFFGRDDQPRMMGRTSDGSAEKPRVRSVYLRFKGGRWQPEPSELGPLGSPEGALYGVLGWDDPEVVCRPGAVCLVKRLSGWKSVRAHAEPMPIQLAGQTAWALAKDHIERLDPSGFVELEPRHPFSEPSSVWVDDAGGIWVAEPTTKRVHHLSGGTWSSFESPIGAPRALLGDAGGVLWLAGDAGVAWWRDGRFIAVSGVAGPLAFAVKSGSESWFAGAAGLYRAQAL